MQVNFEDTKRIMAQVAENVANEVDTKSIGADELFSMVDDECERVAFGDVCTGLQILASYGWSDALRGGVDYEDSPLRKFEDDVFDAAKELLEVEGVNVYE